MCLQTKILPQHRDRKVEVGQRGRDDPVYGTVVHTYERFLWRCLRQKRDTEVSTDQMVV
jgi:hypothetical protein